MYKGGEKKDLTVSVYEGGMVGILYNETLKIYLNICLTKLLSHPHVT
jgi:hypothetical protein